MYLQALFTAKYLYFTCFLFQNYSDIDLLYNQFYTGLDRNLTFDEKKTIMSLATSEVG